MANCYLQTSVYTIQSNINTFLLRETYIMYFLAMGSYDVIVYLWIGFLLRETYIMYFLAMGSYDVIVYLWIGSDTLIILFYAL